MRESSNYWQRMRRERMSRRGLLSAAGRAGVGAAGLALVGCGEGDDDAAVAQVDEQAQAQAEQQAQQQAEQQAQEQAEPAEEQAEEEQAATEPVAGGPVAGGTYNYPSTDGGIFDPAVVIHGGTSGTIWNAYDRLNEQDGNYRITEAMADLAEVVDEQTFVYKIKPNVFWHDVEPLNGRQFTADDASFGLQRFAQDNPEFIHTTAFELIDSFEVVDEFTLRLGASAPFAPLLTRVASTWALMVSRDAVDAFGDTAIASEFDKQIGTGPFIADDRTADAETSFRRNPNWYRPEQPYLDGTRNVWFADSAIQLAAFVSGQIDQASSMVGGNPADLATVQEELGQDEVWGVLRSRTTQGSGAHFNVNEEPYNDPRVRLALHLAANREQLIAVSLSTRIPQTLGGPVAAVLQPYGFTVDELAEIPGYRSGAERDEDVAEARTLLDSTGIDLGNLPPATVWSGGGGIASNMTLVMQSNWSEIGFDIEVEEVGTADFLSIRSSRGGFALVVGGHSGGADPDYMHEEHHTNGGQNYGHYSDPTVDDLLIKGRTTFDIAERKDIYDQAQRYLMTENPPRIFAGHSFGMVIARSYAKGFTGVAHHGFTGTHLANMWFDGKPT
jgi:peptide/nickel transport system substrate-binding protein